MSPDGKWISGQAPHDGVLNVWVAPANDIAKGRRLVDGVLMDEGVPEFEFTTGHTLTAIVRDERGATKTATKELTCQ